MAVGSQRSIAQPSEVTLKPGAGVPIFPKPDDPKKGEISSDGGVKLGDVSVLSDVALKWVFPDGRPAGTDIPGAFELRFTGAAGTPKDCHWLQFGWREILVTARGNTEHEKGTYNGRPLTGKAEPPEVFVDTANASSAAQKDNPYYDPSGQNLDGGSRIFDTPDSAIPDILAQHAADKPTEIVDKLHFTDYLVCESKILFSVQMDVTFTWNGTSTTKKVEVPKGGKPTKKLEPGDLKALNHDVPKFQPPASWKP